MVALDVGRDVQRAAGTIEQPARQMAQQRPDLQDRVDLGVSATWLSSASISRPQFARVENLACGGVRLGDRRRPLAGVFLHAHHEGRAHAVDRRVGHRGGDDLALQAMALHVLGVLFVQRLGEVAHQLARQVRIFRHVRIEQLLEQAILSYDSSTDSSGRVRPCRASCAR
jgi:hypothetical protein